MIGLAFGPVVHRHALLGEHDCADSAKRSHRDAIAANVCSWLLMLENGDAVGLYCSNASGAFDRVRRILRKLSCSGLLASVVRFFPSWLEDRWAIVVEGDSSG